MTASRSSTSPTRTAITAAGSIANGITAVLDGVQGITIFESGGHTYAAASSGVGVQIIRVDITPDTTPPVITIWGPSIETTIVGYPYHDQGAACTDNVDGSPTFTSNGTAVNADTIGSYTMTYFCTDTVGNTATPVSRTVIVKAAPPPAVLTLNATSSIEESITVRLGNANGIAVFESGGNTYAAVTATADSSVQILDITNPLNITAAGSIYNSDSIELSGAYSIAIFESGGNTYAAVASISDDGVQILDITNPLNITAAGSITNNDNLALDDPRGITIFESGKRTYAAVTGSASKGVQILDVTYPSRIIRRRQHHRQRRP